MTLAPPPSVPGSSVRLLPEGAGLRLEILDDRCVIDGKIRRLFPLTDPHRFFAILDGADKEAALVTEIESCEPATRDRLKAELDRVYATPVIINIRGLMQEAGMWRFETVTRRGDSTFFVRNWRDSAVEISRDRWMINSVEGVRYEIPDLNALDPISRKFMDLLL